MGKVRWRHPGLGIFAIFDSNGTTGAADDPNAPRNAPFVDPENHLDKIYMHTELDLMEVSHGPVTSSISHAAIPAYAGAGGEVGANGVVFYGVSHVDHVLVTHGLGYLPDFMVVEGGDLVYPGRPIQTQPDGRQRRIAVYATSTQIILREWSVRTSIELPAATRTYETVVFRRPRARSGNVHWAWNPATGVLEAAFGKFRSDRRYLQVVPGGSPYGFSRGRTIDLHNGAPRYVDPDGSIKDVVPPDFAVRLTMALEPADAPFGQPLSYNGSFAGAPATLVQTP